jgi:hypothetical protein
VRNSERARFRKSPFPVFDFCFTARKVKVNWCPDENYKLVTERVVKILSSIVVKPGTFKTCVTICQQLSVL